MIRAAIAAVLATTALAACGEAVDLPPPGDYTTWERFDVLGPAPGHGDSYRIIYANDIATGNGPRLSGYLEGSILVKEIRDNDDGQPGALRYVALMRRIGPPPATLTEEGGWVFSMTDTPGGDEVHNDFCWARCHVAAPYNGAWYDYRR